MEQDEFSKFISPVDFPLLVPTLMKKYQSMSLLEKCVN